jgi:tRNA nucleotidyltransferase (CCA-adding enzyme)
LGISPHDYDLCTSALPEEICRVFSQHSLVRSGEKHGTIGVVTEEGVIEITTFRTEGDYTDSRHPGWVRFVPSIEEDLARRDFTVNAMAYSPRTGLVDPWGGQQDLQNKILRTVGDPDSRFREDALRILRGVRFASRFHLTPEENTLQAMFRLAPTMAHLARERVFEELCQLLMRVTASDLLRFGPVLAQVIPELGSCIGFQQHSPYHAYDVFTHISHVVENTPAKLHLRWAALLHDVGKPPCFTQDETGRGHFLNHAKVGAQMAEAILLRLKAPTALREQVSFFVSHHMTPIEPDKRLLKRRLSRYGTQQLLDLVDLQDADMSSKGTGLPCLSHFPLVRGMVEEILAEGSCLQLKDLAIDGKDLMALGFHPGPELGKCLQALLNQVLDGAVSNEKEALLQKAREHLTEVPL